MLQSFKLAVNSIWSNKMRSFLTMLGIIIGVAAVIVLISIVSAYMGSIIDSFTSMGANKINVFARNMNSRHITENDMYEFFDEHAEWFDGISPSISVTSTVKKGNENLDQTTVTGVSEDYLKIDGSDIQYGRGIIYSDVAGRSTVCVIGQYVASELFDSAEASLGESLKINGRPFTVVGVLEMKDEDSFEEGGSDDFIWIPYTVAITMARNSFINSWVLTSSDTDYTTEIVQGLKDMLFKHFKSTNFYNVNAMNSIIKELNTQVGTLSVMLGGIAGISLLVAGIGVMNIMLVSVTERTREIGIRKAVGARQGVIMQQFVIEAAVTSMLGGIIGIILGAIVTKSIGAAMDIDAYPTLAAVLISFSVSVGIGLIFGYLPAKRAAMLNPIDALRVD